MQWGLDGDLAREFQPPAPELADALIYCDMTTGPDGQRVTIEQRLADIRGRYGPEHLVTRALASPAPQLAAAVDRVTRRLTACSKRGRAAAAARSWPLVPALACQPM